jgi:hypothetical protein
VWEGEARWGLEGEVIIDRDGVESRAAERATIEGNVDLKFEEKEELNFHLTRVAKMELDGEVYSAKVEWGGNEVKVEEAAGNGLLMGRQRPDGNIRPEAEEIADT